MSTGGERTEAFILWYLPPGSEELGDYLLIGVYSSRDAALEAAARFGGLPGFRDHPDVVDDTDQPGFFVSRYVIDEDHWTEGYRTEPR